MISSQIQAWLSNQPQMRFSDNSSFSILVLKDAEPVNRAIIKVISRITLRPIVTLFHCKIDIQSSFEILRTSSLFKDPEPLRFGDLISSEFMKKTKKAKGKRKGYFVVFNQFALDLSLLSNRNESETFWIFGYIEISQSPKGKIFSRTWRFDSISKIARLQTRHMLIGDFTFFASNFDLLCLSLLKESDSPLHTDGRLHQSLEIGSFETLRPFIWTGSFPNEIKLCSVRDITFES